MSYIGKILARTIFAFLVCSIAAVFAQNSQLSSPLPPHTVLVVTGVMLGLVERKTMPEYPVEAMRKGIQGDVIFKIDVDETGKIVLSVPVEGDPLLVAASVDALRDFHFRPYLLNGTPTRVESQLGFNFSLEGKGVETKGRVDCMSSIPDRPEFRTGVVNEKGVLVLAPRKLSGVEPQLPPELAGKSGSVYLTITIGADGKVQDVKVIGGDEPFISPVVAAVKQYVYEPQLVDGKPSVATTQASYHFGPRH